MLVAQFRMSAHHNGIPVCSLPLLHILFPLSNFVLQRKSPFTAQTDGSIHLGRYYSD